MVVGSRVNVAHATSLAAVIMIRLYASYGSHSLAACIISFSALKTYHLSILACIEQDLLQQTVIGCGSQILTPRWALSLKCKFVIHIASAIKPKEPDLDGMFSWLCTRVKTSKDFQMHQHRLENLHNCDKSCYFFFLFKMTKISHFVVHVK